MCHMSVNYKSSSKWNGVHVFDLCLCAENDPEVSDIKLKCAIFSPHYFHSKEIISTQIHSTGWAYIAVSGYEWLPLQMAYSCAFYMEACFLKVKIVSLK